MPITFFDERAVISCIDVSRRRRHPWRVLIRLSAAASKVFEAHDEFSELQLDTHIASYIEPFPELLLRTFGRVAADPSNRAPEILIDAIKCANAALLAHWIDRGPTFGKIGLWSNIRKNQNGFYLSVAGHQMNSWLVKVTLPYTAFQACANMEATRRAAFLANLLCSLGVLFDAADHLLRVQDPEVRCGRHKALQIALLTLTARMAEQQV